MGGQYGNNQWKVTLLRVLIGLAFGLIITGLIAYAYIYIRPNYQASQAAKALIQESEPETTAAAVQETETSRLSEGTSEEIKTESLTTAPANQSTIAELTSDYIIADSDTRYLSNSDIRNFSIKQVNYAKNEIYARRGRKFRSRELQNYFNSKSWYTGTTEPEAFSESVFNQYEKENTRFLSEVEHSMDANGYQPDR